jgi:hypothetical protein
MKKYTLIFILLSVMASNASAYDYPTIESVRFVINCMTELGGQNEQNLYTCTCRHDVVAENMTFAEYDDATFFDRNTAMPGKRGAMVRDNEKGARDKKNLEELLKKASAQCPVVKHLETPVKDKDAN